MRLLFIILVCCKATVQREIIRIEAPRTAWGKIAACEGIGDAPVAPRLPKIVGYPDDTHTVMLSKSDAIPIFKLIEAYFNENDAWSHKMQECVKALSTMR